MEPEINILVYNDINIANIAGCFFLIFLPCTIGVNELLIFLSLMAPAIILIGITSVVRQQL